MISSTVLEWIRLPLLVINGRLRKRWRGARGETANRVGQGLRHVRAATDEMPHDRPVAADDDRLRNCRHPIPCGDDSIAIEGHRDLPLLPFEHGRYRVARFLEIDGDDFNVAACRFGM